MVLFPRVTVRNGFVVVLANSMLFLACFCIGRVGRAEDLASATLSRLAEDLKYISSDELEGRNSGSEGIRKAAEFIVRRFDSLGLKTDSFDGTPFQDFTIPGPAAVGAQESNTLTIDGSESGVEPVLNGNFTPVSLGKNGSFDGELVFAGYGITAKTLSYDDYAGIDVEGKVVIVLRKEPRQDDEQSPFEGNRSSQYAYFSTKEVNAAVHNAAAMIIVNDATTAKTSAGDTLPGAADAGQVRRGKKIPTLYCTRAFIDPIVQAGTGKTLSELEAAIDSDLKPQSQVLTGITAKGEVLIEQTQTPVRNVVGFLGGAGDLVSEYVVVGAHYDHVGMGGPGSLANGTIAVHNGADDNGSGTTTILEVARRMSEDTSPNRRNIIFIAFTGEEKGLLGSKYYARNPRWPLEDTVAMVNLDMVGRLSENSLTVYGTGTAENFDALIERVNEKTNFNLLKEPVGYGPSDHASFYAESIPVFHFFTGLHNEYHRPGDDFELVNLDGMVRIADMVTDVVHSIATAPDRPKLVELKGTAQIRRPRPTQRRAVLGVQLDSSATLPSVIEVIRESAAESAGIKPGDAIVKIDDVELSNISDLQKYLTTKKPGDKITVSIIRGEKPVEVELMLGEG